MILSAFIIAALIYGCGGGGGGGGGGGSSSGSSTPANTAPVANAGTDQNVGTGALVTLSGAGSSDADGDTLTYGWRILGKPTGSTAALSSATAVSVTFTADLTGTYEIGLIVNDGKASSTEDSVFVYTIGVFTKQLGSASDDSASSVAVDGTYNSFVAGYTVGNLDGNVSAGGYDMFLAKYDPAGTKQWTKQYGSAGDDAANAVALDSGGNIYVVGETTGNLDGNVNSGMRDYFIVKYDSSGNRVWVRQSGTTGDDIAYGVAVDSSGNVYVTGATGGSLDGQANSGGADIFLVKYDSGGTRQWTILNGTAWDDSAYAISLDSSVNIYLAGESYGNPDIIANQGGQDAIVLKLNSSGTQQWRAFSGTTSADYARGVSVDSAGTVIYAAGTTTGGLDSQSNSGGADMFLIRYGSTGYKNWTRLLGTGSADYANAVSIDGSNNAYVAGYTLGGIDGNTNQGGDDIFFVQYDNTGAKIGSATQRGTAASDTAYAVAVDSGNNRYIAGETGGDLDGSGNQGGLDLFIWRP